ncbi:hypothetical protein [Streptomyces sp. NPDC018045]|uniref:hypothetical protein n=1 Tax=Streptomyces sp. NPDC018045 TaxID=3365037 RepID=UPI0037948AFC
MTRVRNEGLNGVLEGHHIDIGEPKNRLAYGRVAQTLLDTLTVTIAILAILDVYCRTGHGQPLDHTGHDTDTDRPTAADHAGPRPAGRFPPLAL